MLYLLVGLTPMTKSPSGVQRERLYRQPWLVEELTTAFGCKEFIEQAACSCGINGPSSMKERNGVRFE